MILTYSPPTASLPARSNRLKKKSLQSSCHWNGEFSLNWLVVPNSIFGPSDGEVHWPKRMANLTFPGWLRFIQNFHLYIAIYFKTYLFQFIYFNIYFTLKHIFRFVFAELRDEGGWIFYSIVSTEWYWNDIEYVVYMIYIIKVCRNVSFEYIY